MILSLSVALIDSMRASSFSGMTLIIASVNFPKSFRSSLGANPSGIEARLISSFMFSVCDSAFTILSWLKSVLTNVTFMPLFAKHWASSIKGITWPCAGYVGMDEENKEN